MCDRCVTAGGSSSLAHTPAGAPDLRLLHVLLLHQGPGGQPAELADLANLLLWLLLLLVGLRVEDNGGHGRKHGCDAGEVRC